MMTGKRIYFGIITLTLALLASPISDAHAKKSYTCTYGANGATRTFQVDDGMEPVCTMSWTFVGGICNGIDMVTQWPQIIRIDGTVINDWRIRPWNPSPVLIRSFMLSKINGGPHGNMMVGNSYVNDAMVGLGANETAMWVGTPPGTGYPFPGTQNDPGVYFDLHGVCTGGGTTSWRVDIAYTPAANEPAAPPPPGAVTWNDADRGPGVSLSINKLSAAGSGSFNSVRATVGYSTGSFRFENRVDAVTGSTSVVGLGTSSMSLSTYVGNSADSVGVQAYGGQVTATGFTCNPTVTNWNTPGDVMGFEVNLDNKTVNLFKNNVQVGGNPWCTWTGNKTLYPAWSSENSANTGTGRFKASSFTTPVTPGVAAWDPN